MSIDVADADRSLTGERVSVRSLADDGIIAQLRVDHPDLFLRPTLRRVPDVTVKPDYWTTVESGETLVFFTAFGADREFENALAADPTVFEPTLLDRYPDRRVYRAALADRVVPIVSASAEVDGRLLECTSSRDRWLVQLRFPTRDALVEFNEYCRAREVSVAVDHLRTSGDDDDGVIALTEKQQELLSVAHEEGYFEVPRGISQDELADRLGVSKSAVSQRLRRAIGKLCGSSLSST